jgi:hypothetical protein
VEHGSRSRGGNNALRVAGLPGDSAV